MIRKLNIWDVPGESAEEKALYAVEMVREMSRDIAEISPASSVLLLRMLARLYKKGTPTTDEVIRELEKAADLAAYERKYAEANMYLALIRRLYVLLIDEERPAVNIEGSDKVVIYDLSRLPSVYLKTIYAVSVLMRTYYHALRTGPKGRLEELLVLEESQNYIHPRRREEPPSIGERLINELRSFGVGVVLIAPDPEQIPPHMSRDVGAVISIGFQSLPAVVLELLTTLRYKDIDKFLKAAAKMRTYIYADGKLIIKGRPKPVKRIIDLGAATSEEVLGAEIKGMIEEVEAETPLRLEEELPAPTPVPSSEGAEVEGRVEEVKTEEAEVAPSEAPSRGTASP